MNWDFFRGNNLRCIKIWLVIIALAATLSLLVACGESSPTVAPVQPTTLSAASPTVIPPTSTSAPSPTAEQPVVVIPPATVTPEGNQGPTATPVATIPPAPTGPVATAPVSTPIGTIPSSENNNTPQGNPVVTAAPPSTLQSVTPADTTQAASTQAITATTSSQNGADNLFYYKDHNLMANLSGEKTPRIVAQKVFGYVQTGANRVVVIQQNDNTPNPSLDLKLVTLDKGQIQTTTLDTRLFEQLPTNQQNERPAGKYGVDTRAMGEMAVSPDGTQIVYTKGNLSGPTFEGISDLGEKPTELWLANLDPKNPAPKKLVPNDKNYIAQPLWSPDGNRITFIRTDMFGTGAGYLTELWSVYKDGSRLAYLTGPNLGKVGDNSVSASPARNIRWLGPQVLGFQAINQAAMPIFLHDLSLGRDLPVVIAPDAALDAVYCDGIQRYVYSTWSPLDTSKTGAYSVGITNPANQTSTVDKDATEIYDCKGNNLLYLNSKGQLTIAKLTPDGTIASSKSMNVGKDFVELDTKLSPNGKMVAVVVGKTVKVLSDSGQVMEIKAGDVQSDSLRLIWASDRVLVGLNSYTQILEVNLDGEKVFKNLDEGDLIDFTPPNEVAKHDFP